MNKMKNGQKKNKQISNQKQNNHEKKRDKEKSEKIFPKRGIATSSQQALDEKRKETKQHREEVDFKKEDQDQQNLPFGNMDDGNQQPCKCVMM